jgi:hypothetical protein
MNTRRQYKPGPSQIARYKANTMSQTKDLNNLTLEYQTVFGKHFTNTTNPVDFPPVVKYPPDDAYPTPEQIKALPDNVQIPQATLDAIQKQFGTALKFDTDKLPLHLLSTEAMNQTAAVLKFGAEKYAEHNWRKGFAWSRPLSAAMRHITAFNAGEDTDPESGLSHLAHAACCIMFLLEFEKTHQDLDDRYKPVVHTIS